MINESISDHLPIFFSLQATPANVVNLNVDGDNRVNR